LSIIAQHTTEEPLRFEDVASDKYLSGARPQVARQASEDRFAGADQIRAALERLRSDVSSHSSDLTPIPKEITASTMVRREDFDRFERSQRLKRTLTPLLPIDLAKT